MSPHVGLLHSVPSPLLCEMFGYAGYDFVVLDLEHVLVSPETLQHLIRACELGGTEPWVRVPEVDEKLIGRVLDAGATGIVISRLETAEQAERAVRATHFPPLGRRGITGGRVTGFGRQPLDRYIEGTRESLKVVPMIESETGLANLPAILTVPGVSLVMEGALDLALDMGLGAAPTHPQVWSALLAIAAHCRAANIPFCANPRDDAQREHWHRESVDWLLAGEDRGLLLAALRHRRRELDFQPSAAMQRGIHA